MLTEEQIKNLKPGDPVIMHGTFDGECPFGNIIIKHKKQMTSGISTKSKVDVHPSCLSLIEDYTRIYFPESLLINFTPDEKEQLTSFLEAYIVDKRKKAEMCALLKKTGINLTDTPSSSNRTFCHVVDSMVKPKHDPARLFKKGDKVQPRSGKTVLASEYGYVTFHELAGQYEVNEDEARGTVTLIVNGHACFVSAFALELITPVEQLEPYLMLENVPSNSIEVRDKRTNKVEATFYFGKDHAYTFEQAATRAEAERDRLNAAYRKDQK